MSGCSFISVIGKNCLEKHATLSHLIKIPFSPLNMSWVKLEIISSIWDQFTLAFFTSGRNGLDLRAIAKWNWLLPSLWSGESSSSPFDSCIFKNKTARREAVKSLPVGALQAVHQLHAWTILSDGSVCLQRQYVLLRGWSRSYSSTSLSRLPFKNSLFFFLTIIKRDFVHLLHHTWCNYWYLTSYNSLVWKYFRSEVYSDSLFVLLIYFMLFFLGEIIIELQLSFIKTNWVRQIIFNLHKLRIYMHITSPNDIFSNSNIKKYSWVSAALFLWAAYTTSCFAESFSLLKRSSLFTLATCMIRMRDSYKVNNFV